MSIYTIKPIKGKGDEDKRKPLGYELFPDKHCSIYISGPTRSGKTSLINHITTHCIDDRCTVYIFAATVNLPSSGYTAMIPELEKRGITVHAYCHFIDDDGNNILADILKTAAKKVETKEKEKETERKVIGSCIQNGRLMVQYDKSDVIEEKKKKAKSKFSCPKRLFIFDDLSSDMRNGSIYQLLSKQRHYRAKTLVSTQSIKDLVPRAINQLNYVILYPGFPMEKIIEFFKNGAIPNLTLDEFEELYKYATSEKYNFLYINRFEGEFRKNFDEEI
jgi:hypothetical protein